VGTGFPLESSLISVKLSTTAGDSDCIIKTLTTTQLTCEIAKMTNEDGTQRNLKISVHNPRYI